MTKLGALGKNSSNLAQLLCRTVLLWQYYFTGGGWEGAFGGPGYMNKMRLDYIQRLFENQNPGLPLNSIRVISVDNGGKNPLFFADVTEEGYSYLLGRNFSLDSMTSKVLFRQVGGKQEQ